MPSNWTQLIIYKSFVIYILNSFFKITQVTPSAHLQLNLYPIEQHLIYFIDLAINAGCLFSCCGSLAANELRNATELFLVHLMG